MKLCIRAHDLGVMGTEGIVSRLEELGIDGIQLVCYKAYEDIPQKPGAITAEKAAAIGGSLREKGVAVPLVGAYFNPVHSDEQKRQQGFEIFSDYLRHCKALGCHVVGSETGSYNDDSWTYNPHNRTEEAHTLVAETFSRLCDIAGEQGAVVAMEGASGHVCHDVKTLAKVRGMMGKPTRVIFDLYNYLDQDNQRQYLQILEEGIDTFGKDILLFHMKDCCFRDGMPARQVPFGTGEMDKHAILARIKAHDPDAVLVLEETVGDDIPLAVKTIRDIWEQV